MKYWLAASVILFIHFASITNIAAGNEKGKVVSSEYYENKVRRLQRNFNATRILKSEKIGANIPNVNAIIRQPSLRAENFRTRLNHFSSVDQRTVEFVNQIFFPYTSTIHKSKFS